MYTFLFNLVYRFKSYLFIWPQTLRFYTSYSIQDNPCNTTKTHNLTRVPYNRDGVMMSFKVSDSGKLKLPSQFSIQIRNDRFCRCCFFFQIKIDLFFYVRVQKTPYYTIFIFSKTIILITKDFQKYHIWDYNIKFSKVHRNGPSDLHAKCIHVIIFTIIYEGETSRIVCFVQESKTRILQWNFRRGIGHWTDRDTDLPSSIAKDNQSAVQD